MDDDELWIPETEDDLKRLQTALVYSLADPNIAALAGLVRQLTKSRGEEGFVEVMMAITLVSPRLARVVSDARREVTPISGMAETSTVAPWDARSRELEATEGPYCVYAAWCEWIEAWNDRQSDSFYMDLDSLDKTALFAAFQAAFSDKHSPAVEA